MLPNVIGLCGQAGAGKDTAAKWFTGRGYVQYGFADPIKWLLNQAFGWSMEDWEDRMWKENKIVAAKIMAGEYQMGYSAHQSPRTLAQWLGTDVVRANFGNDAWVNMWKQRWHDIGQPRTVVADVRFQNEIDAIHKLGGVVVRITRKGDTSGKTYVVNDEIEHLPHASERTGELRNIDHHIANDGTIQDLYDKIAAYAGEKAA